MNWPQTSPGTFSGPPWPGSTTGDSSGTDASIATASAEGVQYCYGDTNNPFPTNFSFRDADLTLGQNFADSSGDWNTYQGFSDNSGHMGL
jgi:hypothetical protein